MTLLDFYFYSAPIAGLVLFFTGAHLGKCARTKEHSECIREVGRLYDELRHLRKEIADLELENVQGKDQVGRLQRQLNFERTTSDSKSEALTEVEEELEKLRREVASLDSLFRKCTRIARLRDARIKELEIVEERLSVLSSQYDKLLRSHLRNGGTTIR